LDANPWAAKMEFGTFVTNPTLLTGGTPHPDSSLTNQSALPYSRFADRCNVPCTAFMVNNDDDDDDDDHDDDGDDGDGDGDDDDDHGGDHGGGGGDGDGDGDELDTCSSHLMP
jgi:hypothetical protein